MRGTHGWAEISRERKKEILTAIRRNKATSGPSHIELDLTDRCNVDCYFCNQQDVRTKEQLPVPRLTELIDELSASGLKSVRLSGGGDPLFHREILPVLDHLIERRVVVDNLTTNGVALTPAVAERLIAGKAREVIISLNAVDAADYHRMLQVKPALFQQVLDNVQHLVTARGNEIHPSVLVQFLIDRENYTRIPEMVALGRSLGVDRIAINAVLEIPRERIDPGILLRPADADAVRPYLEKAVEMDAGHGALQMFFPWGEWNAILEEAHRKTGTQPKNLFPTAPTFKDENGGCFFAWYTAAITGNGNIYPCCLLLNPDYKPLGNIHQATMKEHWNGPAFAQLRSDMRDVLVSGSDVQYSAERFPTLMRACVEPNLCWLKNLYFRGDAEFYEELGKTLDAMRRTRQRKERLHAAVRQHPSLIRAYDLLRDVSRPARIWIKRRLGIELTEA